MGGGQYAAGLGALVIGRPIGTSGWEVTFNRAEQHTLTLFDNPPSGGFPEAVVACPSPNQCTAIYSEGGYAGPKTFNPAKRRHHVSNPTVDASDDVVAVACPSPVQCTAIDFNAEAVTFNPR